MATMIKQPKAALRFNGWELVALESALEEYMRARHIDTEPNRTPFAASIKALYDKISSATPK